MQQQRPPLDLLDIVLLFEEPDYDDGKEIRKRIRRKTVPAYYQENERQVVVRAVSRTTRDLF